MIKVNVPHWEGLSGLYIDGVVDSLRKEGFHEVAIDAIVNAIKTHDDLVSIARLFAEYVNGHRYQLPEKNENEGKNLYRYADRAQAIVEAEGKGK